MKPLFSSDRRHRRRFGGLLAALVTFLVLVPVVEPTGTGRLIVSIGFTAILVAGLSVVSQSRSILAIASVLVVANVIAQFLAHSLLGDAVKEEVLKSLLGAIYFTVLAVALIRVLAREESASLDTVLGGVNVYLLLAITFALLHMALEVAFPGSYTKGGSPLSDTEAHPGEKVNSTFLYFSFVTITTLGYGDIVPARPGAQFLCSAEAIIGQLYVAILIGGLVALWIGGREEDAVNDLTD